MWSDFHNYFTGFVIKCIPLRHMLIRWMQHCHLHAGQPVTVCMAVPTVWYSSEFCESVESIAMELTDTASYYIKSVTHGSCIRSAFDNADVIILHDNDIQVNCIISDYPCVVPSSWRHYDYRPIGPIRCPRLGQLDSSKIRSKCIEPIS